MFLAVWLLGRPPDAAFGTVAAPGFLLAKGRDAFFIENNLVYWRFLALMQNGAYRQINKNPTSTVEVDNGTWEQAADGAVHLHSVHHALRFRALIGGPLNVVLDSREKIDGLPDLAKTLHQWLGGSEDAVFDAHAIGECGTSAVAVGIDPHAATFSRADLQSLLRQIDDAAASERTGTYFFTPLKMPGVPGLLILRDAVFQADDLARVRREYRVKPGEAPPFFFAQVDARTFAREVGTWEAFRFLGGTD